jgi:cytochrome P450 family 6
MLNEFYSDFDGQRFGGLYTLTTSVLLLRDPEIIKAVLVKDFDKFHSRGFVINEKKEPLQGHLIVLSGSRWRNLRVKLSPVFTSGKMKMMFGTLVDCGKELQSCFQKPANNGETTEIKDISARYSTHIITSCAFGIQCNCLKNPDAEFRNWGREIFKPSVKSKLRATVRVLLPSAGRLFRLSTLPDEVRNYFMNMVQETVEYREKNNVVRNDFMQLMIQLKNKTLGISEEDDIQLERLDIDDVKKNEAFGK